ncbi:MAG: DUF3307 domain-containing protein [Anaerolineae bacterium]
MWLPLIAGWLLQNDWMAKNKTSLRHPAAWAHAAIQGVALTLAFGWQAGLILGLAHLLVDTRVPLHCWQRFYRQTADGLAALHVVIRGDQVLHVVSIALWIATVT